MLPSLIEPVGSTASADQLSLSFVTVLCNPCDRDCSDGVIQPSKPEQFAAPDGAINHFENQRTALLSARVAGEICKGC